MSTERNQRGSGDVIPIGNGGQHVGRSFEQRGHELLLRAGINRHIEEDDWRLGPTNDTGAAPLGGDTKQRRAVVDARASELFLDAGEQPSDVRVGLVFNIQPNGLDAREPQLM